MSDYFDLRKQISIEVYIQFRISHIQIFLEFPEGHLMISISNIYYLIPIFELAIVLTLLLYCIICQVYELILNVVDVVLLARCPDIAILIEIALLKLVHTGYQPITSEVKLPLLNEQWFLNVLLYNEG